MGGPVILSKATPQKAGRVCGLEKNIARIRKRSFTAFRMTTRVAGKNTPQV